MNYKNIHYPRLILHCNCVILHTNVRRYVIFQKTFNFRSKISIYLICPEYVVRYILTPKGILLNFF